MLKEIKKMENCGLVALAIVIAVIALILCGCGVQLVFLGHAAIGTIYSVITGLIAIFASIEAVKIAAKIE